MVIKVRYWNILLLAAMVLAACSNRGSQPSPEPTITLPAPQVNTTSVPDAQVAATSFLEAWKAEDYPGMYNALSKVSRDAISLDDFTKRYKETAINLSLDSLQTDILSSMTNPTLSQVAYRVTFKTVLLGEVQRDMLMNLVLEENSWKIQWEDGMILPELRGGNRLALDIKIPSRGNIYDRNGETLVAQSEAYAVGVIPGQIEEGQYGVMVNQLSRLTGQLTEWIDAKIEDVLPQDYVIIGEVPAQFVQDRYEALSGLLGLWLNPFTSRFYFDGGIAPHVTGYVLSIPAEEAEIYQRRGYRVDERVGAAGLEKWGENYLSGGRGASLYVVDPQGTIVTRISQSDTYPSMSIYTTLDSELQVQAQQAIEGFRGAIVVMERDTGRVLAMASSPSFDPNLFEPTNYNSNYGLNELFSSSNTPLLNRATQGGYPLGSVFKIITMAAALESGIYTPETKYICGHDFTEIPGEVYYDWTYEKGIDPSGELTLSEGLMRSCNPYFYHIGLDLFRQNRPQDVPTIARGFGLGSATGIGQVAEDVGSVPDQVTEGDAVQMAIGQGELLVTPLQVVDFVAAIGNGGTLYRPQVVDKIVSPNGDVPFTFTPEVRGTLPIKDETLKAIQDAMLSVIENRRGTAHNVFLGMNIALYGKTGTAQTSTGRPHAWFAGYTAEENPEKPNIAMVVIAENTGEGSEIAAPIFRRVLEVYYFGKPTRLYPWESSYYVTKTPTPTATNTATPGPAPTETQTPTPEGEQPS